MTRFAGLLSLALCLSSAAFGADYPAFLVAQFAASQGQLDAAATQMLAALHADPGNADLTGDAFALA
ncbi:hypothetical protein, partial [Enterococcus faecium]|uniref:hypothetical protein n=1 Tax=Enterococcus faecium TaxID=1352 RepID=UPI003F5211C4